VAAKPIGRSPEGGSSSLWRSMQQFNGIGTLPAPPRRVIAVPIADAEHCINGRARS